MKDEPRKKLSYQEQERERIKETIAEEINSRKADLINVILEKGVLPARFEYNRGIIAGLETAMALI